MNKIVEDLNRHNIEVAQSIAFYLDVEKKLGVQAVPKLISFMSSITNNPSISDRELAIDIAARYLTPTCSKLMYDVRIPGDSITTIAWDEVNFCWYEYLSHDEVEDLDLDEVITRYF